MVLGNMVKSVVLYNLLSNARIFLLVKMVSFIGQSRDHISDLYRKISGLRWVRVRSNQCRII